MIVYPAIFVLVLGATLLLVYGVRSGSHAQKVRASLDRLETYDARSFRETELSAPVGERLLRPTITKLAAVGGLITPTGRIGRLQNRVEQAGRPWNLDLSGLLAMKVLALLGVLLAVVAVGAAGFLPVRWMAPVALVAAVAAYYVPDLLLVSWLGERRRRISRSLPDFLDLLTVTVEAGLGLESAMARISSRVRGPLGEELLITLHHMRIGQTRELALRAMAGRCGVKELHNFVSSLVQAQKLGTPLGKILRIQAQVIRTNRRQSIELAAQKAPVKMLFPLMICIFPTLFVVILGPAAIRIYDAFAG
ncbi:MAG: type II secretion system F family protein [Thermoleophilia bacterium]